MRDQKRPPLRGPHTNENASRQKYQHRNPKKHEESVAKELGGKRQPGSGSQYHAKGDIANVCGGRFDFHGECKTTSKKSRRLETRWLNKITGEAAHLLKYPFLAIRFDEEVIRQLVREALMTASPDQHIAQAEQDWVAIPQSVFSKMLSDLEEFYDV